MARMSRASSERTAQGRAPVKSGYQGTLHVPKAEIPKGKVYRWVREYIQGEADDNNVEARLRNGWAPVPADRHPSLVAPVLPGRERQDHGVIRRGGLILCEMSEAEFKEWQKSVAQENADAMNSTAWTRGELQDDDRRMPMIELADDPGMNTTQIERVVSLPDK